MQQAVYFPAAEPRMWPLIGLLRVGAPRLIATALIPAAIAVGYIGVKAEV